MDFEWKNYFQFKLAKFNGEFTYISHISFLNGAIGVLGLDQKKFISGAIEREEREALGERLKNKLREG